MIRQLADHAGNAVKMALRPVSTAAFVAGFAVGTLRGARRLVGAGAPSGSTPSGAAPKRADARGEAQVSGEQAPPVSIVEPVVPQQQPIPIVEQVLAAEAAGGPASFMGGGGHATEPHVASRAELHGEAGYVRAEREELAEETDEALHP